MTRLSLPKWLCAAVSAVTLLPLISPPFTSSIALTLSLGPNGILLDFFGLGNFNFYGFWGTFISETLLLLSCSVHDALDDSGAYRSESGGCGVFARSFELQGLPHCDAAPRGAGHCQRISARFSCSLADFATPQVLGGHSFRCCRRRPIWSSPACMTSRAAQRFHSCCSFPPSSFIHCSAGGSARRVT